MRCCEDAGLLVRQRLHRKPLCILRWHQQGGEYRDRRVECLKEIRARARKGAPLVSLCLYSPQEHLLHFVTLLQLSAVAGVPVWLRGRVARPGGRLPGFKVRTGDCLVRGPEPAESVRAYRIRRVKILRQLGRQRAVTLTQALRFWGLLVSVPPCGLLRAFLFSRFACSLPSVLSRASDHRCATGSTYRTYREGRGMSKAHRY